MIEDMKYKIPYSYGYYVKDVFMGVNKYHSKENILHTSAIKDFAPLSPPIRIISTNNTIANISIIFLHSFPKK